MLHPELLTAARSLDLDAQTLLPYGREKAKLPLSLLGPRRGRLVLVSAITPTPAGEGKTTTSIGLVQGLAKAGQRAAAALRQPSLGPCFGMKGGATGGGASCVHPIEDINLHFTGDFHAISAAHNLLSAMVDNHLHWKGTPSLDARRVTWKRVVDMNDRALRRIITGLGGRSEGVPREAGFDITAASEVMAVLCLSEGYEDLRARLARLIVGYDSDGAAITAGDIGASGAMLALLKDALLPNLVRTTEGVPAFLHGGPFANIAHGCNSVIATRMALAHADWVVTEAGFAFDLGGEKFLDIKARAGGLDPVAVVLVATVKALKHHGMKGKDDPSPGPELVERGLPNLAKHVESVRAFGIEPIVAINRFGTDTPEEMAVIRAWCDSVGVACAASDHFARGGDGARELAEVVMERAAKEPRPVQHLYPLDMAPAEKMRVVAKAMYGARDVVFTGAAASDLADVKRRGFSNLPICVAKVPASLSDDPTRRGRPTDFDITVRNVVINAGAGFLVMLTGEIMRMPGLPQRPNALDIDVVDGKVVGLR